MILFSRPEYDFPTRYTSRWAKKIVDFARDKGYDVADLGPKRAKRKTIESFFKRHDISLAMFSGHGGPDRLYGQDGEPIVTAGENVYILEAVIVYSVACRSALILGPEAISQGAKAYVGYKRDFSFTYTRKKTSDVLSDERARPFFKASNLVVISLLKGHNAGYAVERSKNSFQDSIGKLMTSEATDNDIFDATLLSWNMVNQVCLGDPGASL